MMEQETGTEALLAGIKEAAAARRAANIALMQLIVAAPSEAAVETALSAARASLPPAYAQTLLRYWTETPNVFWRVKTLATQVNHAPQDGETPASALARFRRSFDAAAAVDPIGSVALYTLGRNDLRQSVMCETIALIDDLRLLTPAPDVVEVGSGTGGLATILAKHCRTYIGLDLSPTMVALAREARGPHTNLSFNLTNGRHLAAETQSADLVLAVDVMPYAELAGETTARDLLLECARVLRAGGTMLALNYAYDCSAQEEAERALSRAQDAGLILHSAEPAAFTHWDARVFLFRKPSSPTP